MKRMHFLAFLLIFVSLFFSLTVLSHAAVWRTATGSDADDPAQSRPPLVTAVTHETYDLDHITAVKVIQNDTGDYEGLLQALISYIRGITNVTVTVQTSSNATNVSSSVSWNLNDIYKIDPGILGQYSVTASIDLFDQGEYVFEDGVMQQIQIPVEIIVPEEPVLISGVSYDSQEFKGTAVVLVNGDLESALEYFYDNVDFYEAGSTRNHHGILRWDTSSVDLHTPGLYKAAGVFHLPMHCEFAPDAVVPELTLSVIVQEPDKPELYDYMPVRYGTHFPWIVSEDAFNDMKVWISKDDGPWEEFECKGMTRYDTTGLYLHKNDFSPDSSYRIQVDYKDGKTGILSFSYGDILIISSYLSGDRDGGDTDGYPPLIGIGKPNGGAGSGDSDGDSSGETDSIPPLNKPSQEDRPETSPPQDDTPETSPPQDNTPETNPAPDAVPDEASTDSEPPEYPVPETDAPEMNPTETVLSESVPLEMVQDQTIPETTVLESSAQEIESSGSKESISKNMSPDIATSDAIVAEAENSEDTTIQKYLPTLAIFAALVAILSLLFLIFAKRRNEDDMESP